MSHAVQRLGPELTEAGCCGDGPFGADRPAYLPDASRGPWRRIDPQDPSSGDSYNSVVQTLLVALLVSALVTLVLVRLRHVRERAADHDFSKPQKFHVRAVPRVGSVGIVAGLAAAALPLAIGAGEAVAQAMLLLLACAAPAVLVGLVQDVTDAVSPKGRLVATALSATLAFFLLDAAISRTHLPGLDWVVAFAFGSLLVTVLSVTGIANAMNIIDGFNGLASMCAAIMLGAIAYVAFQVDDRLVAMLAVAGVGAILGFFLWNFPAGLIFLGDGGAYFLGFYVAELAILLLARNQEVSPMFALLICVYPIFETLFSVYRRWVLRATPASLPDGIHLHSLIYRRLLRWAAGNRNARSLTRRNSMTSPYLWVLCMMSVVPAVLFWDNSMVLAPMLVVFCISYVLLYRRIVRFRSPRWMRLGSSVTRPMVPGDNPPR